MAFLTTTTDPSMSLTLLSSAPAKSARLMNALDGPLCQCNNSSTMPNLPETRRPKQVGPHIIQCLSDPILTFLKNNVT
jgi:hypothetical protein